MHSLIFLFYTCLLTPTFSGPAYNHDSWFQIMPDTNVFIANKDEYDPGHKHRIHFVYCNSKEEFYEFNTSGNRIAESYRYRTHWYRHKSSCTAKLSYDSLHRLTCYTQFIGISPESEQYTYTASGHLHLLIAQSQNIPADTFSNFSYNQQGQVISNWKWSGHLYTYSYNKEGDLIKRISFGDRTDSIHGKGEVTDSVNYTKDIKGNKLISHYLYDPWHSYNDSYFLVDSLKLNPEGMIIEYYNFGSGGSRDNQSVHLSLSRGQKEIQHYDSLGRLVSSVVSEITCGSKQIPDEPQKSYHATYNSQGWLVEETTFEKRGHWVKNHWEPYFSTNKCFYDSTGLLIHKQYVHTDKQFNSTLHYSYALYPD